MREINSTLREIEIFLLTVQRVIGNMSFYCALRMRVVYLRGIKVSIFTTKLCHCDKCVIFMREICVALASSSAVNYRDCIFMNNISKIYE